MEISGEVTYNFVNKEFRTLENKTVKERLKREATLQSLMILFGLYSEKKRRNGWVKGTASRVLGPCPENFLYGIGVFSMPSLIFVVII